MFGWFKKNSNSHGRNPFAYFDDVHHQRSERVGAVQRKNSDILDLYQNGESTTQFVGKSLSDKKVLFFLWAVYLGFFLLLGKSFYLQVVQGAGYRQLAEKNRIRTDFVKTTRGLIYDRNGVVLVKNVPKFIVSVIPFELPYETEERANILRKLSDILEIDYEELNKNISEIDRSSLYYYQPFTIKDQVAYEEAIKLSISSESLSGVYVQTDIKREYLHEGMQSISHILGYTGKINAAELEADTQKKYLLTDIIGKTGVEKYYERELRGMHGVTKTEVDAYGREKKILEQEDKRLGSNIVLTIDADLQRNLEQIIYAHLAKIGKRRASAVAVNPQNGEVLAMVSLPSFDNNLFSGGIDQETYQGFLNDPDNPLFARSISGEYPSGSTFKMVMAAATLQEGIINRGSAFLSAGGIRIGEWFFPDWKAGGHGITDVRKALAESVNTFFYIVGGGFENIKGLGVDKIHVYSKLFGLGKRLGIDLPGERPGFLPSREWKEQTKGERWYIGDTYHFSIGQGDLLVTPLQVAMYTAAIANGGAVYKPHVVKEVINPNDDNIATIEPRVLESGFIDQENIQIVQQGLRSAVTMGSARRLNYLSVPIAGKTGTAQWSSDGEPHAWFTSYAPYDNPQVALTILVEQGGEGSAVAVPIAEDFYRYWIARGANNGSDETTESLTEI